MQPVPICDFEMETQKGDKFTHNDLKGSFSLLMFGESVSDHAMQGLAKMQEIVVEQGTPVSGTFLWALVAFVSGLLGDVHHNHHQCQGALVKLSGCGSSGASLLLKRNTLSFQTRKVLCVSDALGHISRHMFPYFAFCLHS